LRADQRIQRATMPLEEETVANMWEISEAFKMEYGVGRRASARVRLGTDPSRGPCPERSRMDQDDNGREDGGKMVVR